MPFETFFNLSEDKKKIIIDASMDEFSKNGYEKSSIANIIKKAGIPRGSFYQYFNDKLDLYKYILEQIGTKKNEFTKEHSRNVDDLIFTDIIKDQFIRGVHFYRQHPDMAKIANDFILIRDQHFKKSILGNGEEKSKKYLYSLIDERKEMGEIDKNLDNEMVILFIHSLNRSFVEQFIENTDCNYYDDSLFDVIFQMMRFLKKGLSSDSFQMGE